MNSSKLSDTNLLRAFDKSPYSRRLPVRGPSSSDILGEETALRNELRLPLRRVVDGSYEARGRRDAIGA